MKYKLYLIVQLLCALLLTAALIPQPTPTILLRDSHSVDTRIVYMNLFVIVASIRTRVCPICKCGKLNIAGCCKNYQSTLLERAWNFSLFLDRFKTTKELKFNRYLWLKRYKSVSIHLVHLPCTIYSTKLCELNQIVWGPSTLYLPSPQNQMKVPIHVLEDP